ncbi:MAG: threonine ammonia-lyase, biosynthetic [Myxococcales bacterium]|nr:threonine ammonia-lyase, biosynthetic [Myxococcales bacterium]MDH5566572.1 threonine ammonia-lyase, biosynthetic [Myxococcales bacterium]
MRGREGDAALLAATVERIERARVYDLARETPLQEARRLSARLGSRVLIKREDLQPIFSFKVRGACNKIVSLPREQAERGLVAASAGNHAQGVALAAAHFGTRATIYMPRVTPRIKVDAVAALGGGVVLHGESFDEALAEALRCAEKSRAVFVHGYDDPEVIAGQGTIAVEIFQQHPDPIDAIFVPVGGGGLIAGILAYAKIHHPETAIVAVEPDDAASLEAALRADRPVRLDHVGIFADGAAVGEVGAEVFRILRGHLDDHVSVSADEICAAIRDLFHDTRVVAEPAGALALAGMKRWIAQSSARAQQRTYVVIQSGANINFHGLPQILERVSLGEEREAIFAVKMPERPGACRNLCSALGDHDIIEFSYRYANADDEAHIFLGVEVSGGASERAAIALQLKEQGYEVVDMTGNDMALVHARHMVGGRVPDLRHERLLRFEFPQRPGALRRFIDLISPSWNLTLFHYRKGAARGWVLAGIQVPPEQQGSFLKALDELGYPWVDETGNEAYRLFLR